MPAWLEYGPEAELDHEYGDQPFKDRVTEWHNEVMRKRWRTRAERLQACGGERGRLGVCWPMHQNVKYGWLPY
jgi:hypothetical protein